MWQFRSITILGLVIAAASTWLGWSLDDIYAEADKALTTLGLIIAWWGRFRHGSLK